MAAKKLKEVQKRLVIDPFNYMVYIIISNDVKASAAKRGINITKPWIAMHAGTDRSLSLIIVPYSASVESIAHEACHCTWHIMKTLGAEFEDEIMAYTTGHVTAAIHKLLRKHRPVQKPKRVKMSRTQKEEKTN